MKKVKKLSVLLASTMLFNIFAFPTMAWASSADNMEVYKQEDDTTPYIMGIDTKAPVAKAQTVLDISRGNITIAHGSVTGFTPSGSFADVNPNGYEITGSTNTNTVIVNNAVPIAIKNLNINYSDSNAKSAINMVAGGEITVLGTNTINILVEQMSGEALIGQDSGQLIIKGDGTLNMRDADSAGTTIGGNYQKAANIWIGGSVTINARKTGRGGVVIGGYYAGSKIVITENANVTAAQEGTASSLVIGSHGYGATNITFSGKAKITATSGPETSGLAVIGIIADTNSNHDAYTAKVSIEDGAYVKLSNSSTKEGLLVHTAGMGFSESEKLTSERIKHSDIRIAQTANVEAPVRETYYKALDGTTPVYRALTQNLSNDTYINVTYADKTSTVSTQLNGYLYLYLPLGVQNITIDGSPYQGTVNASGTLILTQQSDNIKKVIDISKDNISISSNSITAKTPEGKNSGYDIDGYEIIGNTTANNITVFDAVPIVIRNIRLNYSSPDLIGGINMVNGGEITILGENSIDRRVEQTSENALIGQDTGRILIKGNGRLNITDAQALGTTIGGNKTKAGNIHIGGDVTIGVTRRARSAIQGAIIGGGSAAANTTIMITDNAKINALIDSYGEAPVIGSSVNGTGNTNITISGRAQVVSEIGNGNGLGVALGAHNSGNATANITIEDGTSVKVSNMSTATETASARGMGISINALIGNATLRTNIKVSNRANIDAPARESFYKALNGSTPVYKVTSNKLAPNTDVNVTYSGVTTKVKTDSEGHLYLYLPLGMQTVDIDGAQQSADVNTRGTAKLVLTADNIQTILDIGKASINITNTSITAKTPEGIDAPLDPDGYEIIGTTDLNNILVNDSVPITINGISVNYNNGSTGYAIRMAQGGDITVLGTNSFFREVQGDDVAFITHNSGTLNIKGDGTLDIRDNEDIGAVIGSNFEDNANVNISGSLTINVTKEGSGAVIGTGNRSFTSIANITIEDSVRITINDNSTEIDTRAVGLGLPKGAPINREVIARSNVKVSPRANIGAPVRENYYKTLNGIDPAYKTVVYGLSADADVSLTYGGVTAKVKTLQDASLNLYLPVGNQIATINSETFESIVGADENNKMFIKTILKAGDISAHVSDGAIGYSLRGHETTNSPGGTIKYTITDAGKTEAVLNKTTLHWSKPGIIKMNVSQTESGKYSQASKDFIVTIIETPGNIELNIAVDPASAAFGKISVINEADKEITPFVQPGEEIRLKAKPNEGYELAKWVKTITTVNGAREVTTITLPAVNELRIIANAGESYTAFFRVRAIVPGPKLSVLEVSTNILQSDGTFLKQTKPLIRQDGTESTFFDPEKLVYGLYLRSIDTNNINIYVRHNDTKPLNIKIANSNVVSIDPFNQYKISLAVDGSAYQAIPILVSDGVKETTYTIEVFKKQKTENDPHMYAELEINPVKKVLELGIYAMNVDVNALSMTIAIDELLPSDKQAFESFVNNNGIAFNNLTTNLATGAANYFNLDSQFELADMRSDGKFVHITVNAKPGWETISPSSKPRKILSINIKRNPNYKGEIIDEIDTLRMEPVKNGTITYGNNLQSKFYGDLNDTFQAKRLDDEKTLAYLVFKGEYDYIKMFVSFDANKVGRVTYEIINISDKGVRELAGAGDVVNRDIIAPVIQSTYRVRVLAGGYLLAESENIVYTGKPSQDGIIMTPVRLLEGDLDDNDVIDGVDRTKLISVLNRKVLVSGSGFVEFGGGKIYADYNNDNNINALDLGRLVKNIGKKYSEISKL